MGGLLYLLIDDKDVDIDFFASHWIEIAIPLKMPFDLRFLVGKSAGQQYGLVHQLIRDAA